MNVRRLDNSNITTTKIDGIVKRYMREASVTGLALSIINDNKLIYSQAYGYENKQLMIPLTENSIMSGASLSKFVFAYIVSRLVENNVLDLDMPLYSYLEKPIPEYDQFRDLKNNENWKKITARHCLSHSTGFPNSRYFNQDHKLEIFFEPGTSTAYSGEGFTLLQFVIEKLTDSSLEDLVQKIVFEPLEMRNSSYISQNICEKNIASGHNLLEEPYKIQTYANPRAGGSLQTSALDFSKFILHLLVNKDESYVKRIISPSIRIKKKYQFPSLSTITTDEYNSINLSYGLGCVVMDTETGKAFFKEGHGLGFQNYSISFPEAGTSIILLSNSDNAELVFKYLLEELIKDNYTLWEWEGYIPYDKLDDFSIGRYLYDIIVMESVDKAINTYLKIKESKMIHRFIFNEAELNNLGYQLIKEGKINQAIKLFTLNVEEYPKSANTYDSLGEAYLINEEYYLALKYYQKSYNIFPNEKTNKIISDIKRSLSTIND